MVIDSHCHILPPSFLGRRAELAARDATFAGILAGPKATLATAETLVKDMDRDGVARSVVMGMGWAGLAVAQEANDYIMESVERFPDRLVGFCSVNPAWGDAAASEVGRCAAAGLRGIGELHPDTQGFDITDRATMVPLMNNALRLGLPVLVHASEPAGHQYPGKGQTTPDKLYRFIENFPESTTICAHWGGGLPFYALMPEVPEIIKNVYFDTAASPFLYQSGVFPTVASLVGATKILFASDYPLIRPWRLMVQLEESGLGPEDREAILAGNAARLFDL